MRTTLRSLMVALVIASGYAVAGVSIGELAVSSGSAQTLALTAAAVLAATALVVALSVVARSGSRRSTSAGVVRLRALVEPRVSPGVSLPHLLPSPRAPAVAFSATA